MNRNDEEKARLVLQCTCDRMHWKVQRLRAQRRTSASEVIEWVHRVDHWAGPLLPRWWRTGYAAFRAVFR